MRFGLLLLFFSSFLFADELDSFITKIQEGEKKYDDQRFPKLIKELQKWVSKNSQNRKGQYWLARAYLAQCNIERFLRRELKDGRGKQITREGTAKIAREAIDLITPVLEKNPQWSEGFRVRGELFSHTITGFVSGLSNGPKALEDMNKAMEHNSNNPYAHIAMGKMFYYNPPVAGGDVDKGIASCKKAYKLGGEDTALTLLGRCYIKKGRPERAKLYLRKALRLNPDNIEASYFLKKALR